MTWLCACDVGIKYHAEAWFEDGRLHEAKLVHGVGSLRSPEGLSWREGDRLVIECATVRKADGASKKKEVDALNRAAGRLGALHPNPEFMLPEAWKGQLPKKISHTRTLALLTEAERAILPSKKSELLHVLDAVGLGLRALGRRQAPELPLHSISG